MHYLLLGIGIVLGLWGLYRFFLNAITHQIVAAFMAGGFIAVCGAIVFMAITGRLPAAVSLLVALYPFVWGFLKNRAAQQRHNDAGGKHTSGQAAYKSGSMTRDEALDVLNLKEGATRKDIIDAHKKLIRKLHPDQEGSSWLTARINQARDTLLN